MVDISLKAGEIEAALLDKQDEDQTGNCCVRNVRQWLQGQRACWAATCGFKCCKPQQEAQQGEHEHAAIKVDSQAISTASAHTDAPLERRPVDKPDHAKDRASGPARRAAALQLPVHQQWVELALADYDEEFDIEDLNNVMAAICGDHIQPDKFDVQLVLRLAGYNGSETTVLQHDVSEPLAMWRSLNQEVNFIQTHFADYDTDCSHTLHREQLERMLTDINDGAAPSKEEVDWILSFAADTAMGRSDDECPSIGINELRAGVAVWFHHVSPIRIHAKRSCWKLVPYLYAGVAAVTCCFVVAATTTLFSEEKTREWFASVLMSLVWKLVLIDAIKATFFGKAIEFIFGLMLGECVVETAMLSVLQAGIEGAAEEAGEVNVSANVLPDDALLDDEAPESRRP
jgi:hypothetical protein